MTDLRRAAIAEEQRHLDAAVRRRDVLVDELAQRPDTASRERATMFAAVADGLVFGRIDTDDEQWRIGRVGIRDAAGDPLVLDWRAPLARAFYTATAADPQGLRSRRHIATDGLVVTGVDDEPLCGDTAGLGALVGEGALLNALDARRTGQMTQIVATLQREQDDIVRAAPHGALVVQGGPGTGKTAVALHRAAYLLFTHDRIARRGVLIVGPNDRFLHYIDQVLPSLGETQVVQLSPSRLLPGIVADSTDTDAAARVKGDAVWADILPRAVAERRAEPAALTVEWAGTPITIDRAQMARVIAEIQAGDDALRVQRERYVEQVTEALATAIAAESQRALEDVEAGFEDVLATVDRSIERDNRVAARRADLTGADVTGQLESADAAPIAAALLAEPETAAALERIWPTVDPRAVLADLLGDAASLERLAPELSAAERAVVGRGADRGWSAADVALLDELAALVGAPASLGAATGGMTFSAKAAADRTWTYGHVIVDEAQELSAMQWRALARRCPTLSFTIVGDVNQTASAAGTGDWSATLRPVFGERMREQHLTICYRTPREVMDLTPPILAAAGSTVAPPQAARSNGIEPRRVDVPFDEIADIARKTARELADEYAGGQVSIIWPDGFDLAPEVSTTARSLALPHCSTTGKWDVVEISASGAKGLEFDAVVLVEPADIAAGTRGWNALYVALTRCTQQLVVIASKPGPPELAVRPGSNRPPA